MADTKTAASGGTSVFTLLGVAFVVLKLCHVIDWPWLWVLAPFWLPFTVLMVGFGVFMLGVGGIALVAWLTRPR